MHLQSGTRDSRRPLPLRYNVPAVDDTRDYLLHKNSHASASPPPLRDEPSASLGSSVVMVLG